MVVQMAKKGKYRKINKFIKKVVADSKPIEHKKIQISDVDMPKQWKMERPQETGFVWQDFEVIVDAEDK